MKEKILEDVAFQCHCFISDLHNLKSSRLMLEKLKDFPFDQYSLEECDYCFSYILDRPIHFKHFPEIGKCLKDLFNEKFT